ncbi:MAG: TIGR00266 family protein [Candidatus Anstonellales archaeon]
MKYTIKRAFGSYVELDLEKGEVCNAEPGALVSSSGEIKLESKLQGGLGGALMRSLGGGESLFINKITAQEKAKVVLAGPIAGDVAAIELDNEEYLLGDNCYFAHTGEVEVTAKLGGLTSLTAGSGLAFALVKGKGTVFIGAGGSIVEKELKDGETFYVDNGSFIAASTKMKIEKFIAGHGLASKILGGEGIMFKVHGPGRLYYETHSVRSLASLVASMIPKG